MWTNSCCRCIMMSEPPDVENSSCLKPSVLQTACRKWDRDRLCKHDLHFHCTEISLYILSHAVSEAASWFVNRLPCYIFILEKKKMCKNVSKANLKLYSFDTVYCTCVYRVEIQLKSA